MPYSANVFDTRVKELLIELNPHTILDIGAGAGKYGVLARRISSDVTIQGIEPDSSYIANFDLERKYDQILNITVEEFIDEAIGVGFCTDVVIMGDVIEHLKKSSGIDVINFLVYRCKKIIMITPKIYTQDNWVDPQGNSHIRESHISVWRPHDFMCFDFTYQEQDNMQLIVIDGFL